jgi:hypothetical protein
MLVTEEHPIATTEAREANPTFGHDGTGPLR